MIAKLIILLGVILYPWGLFAGEFEKDFTVVFIDEQTEAKYGTMPLSRSLIAQGLERLTEAKAKAVVLKFFYDQPKDETIDASLEKALARLPVALQARLDDSEKNPNTLPMRFFLPEMTAATAISGNNGWIPLKRFSDHAKTVGFVDFTSSPIPLLETYQGKTVKSLIVCSIELAIDQEAVIQPGKNISIGTKSLSLDAKNQITTTLPNKDEIQYIPFHTILNRTAPTKALAGKVIILGYDGPHAHTVDSPLGKLGAHRAFVHHLKSTYEQMTTKQATPLSQSPQ